MPTTIVGANVNEKPNFLAIAYCGIVQHAPPLIAIGLGKMHYTNSGIKKNRTFSVNIPSEDLLELTDYVGIKSGKLVDKSKLFKVFYGELKTAPMIEETPLNLECKLVETLNFSGNAEIFIGQIIQTYAQKQILSQGLPEIQKLKPILFSMHDNNYFKVGEHLAKAWNIGLKYKNK
ncbi:MAG: flavin reductase family protein [Candidatus Omnitrophica bacterium]|nr:flavin reductase family protein [Candidatus Omnitrophota bacterium]